MKRRTVMLALACGVTLPTAGYPVSLEEAIEARRAYKQVILHNSRELFAMAMDETPYDAARARLYAENLKSLTRMENGSLWPEGSDWEHYRGKTRALPLVWESDDIYEHHAAFQRVSGELAGVAGEGLEPLRSKIGELENVCRDCHLTFRAKDF